MSKAEVSFKTLSEDIAIIAKQAGDLLLCANLSFFCFAIDWRHLFWVQEGSTLREQPTKRS
jgi:hypothetical protein